jgi:hypothetical protein
MLLAGCGHSQRAGEPPKPLPAPALFLAPIAGQPIPILPVTFIVSDSGLPGLPVSHTEQAAWADSIIGDAFEAHGPEVHWLRPPELRRIARRATGMMADPDHMTQAVMRFQNLSKVPDPLLGNLRTLIALTGSRVVMIPASLRFSMTPGGIHAEVVLVLADARSGQVTWRSTPVATAPTASAALAATIGRILPDLR